MNFASGQVPSALAALAVVVGLIWLCARFARMTGFGRTAVVPAGRRALVLEDTIMLDRSRRLHLVRLDGRGIVLLTGGATDLLLELSGSAGREGAAS